MRATVLAVLTCASWTAALAGPTIDSIAPPETFLMVHVPSLPAARAAWEGSALKRFAEEPGVAAWTESLLENELPDFESLRKAWGEALEGVGHPTGAAGIASFLAADEDEPGEWQEAELVMVEWGEGAEAAEEKILDWLEEQEAAGVLTLDDEAFGDLRVWTISPPAEAKDADAEDWDNDESIAGSLAEELDLPWTREETAYFTRIGGVLVASTQRGALDRAIESVEGRDRDVVGDAAEARDALAWRPAGAVAQVVLLPSVMLEVGGADRAGMMLDDSDRRMAEAFGLAGVRWVSAAALLDARGTIGSLVAHARVPEKGGVFSILDVPGRAFAGSPLAGPDSAMVYRMLMDMGKVMPLAREIVAATPPEQRGEAEMVLAQAGGFVEPLLAAVGPEVHIVGDITQPYSIESRKQVVAIAVKDRQVVANTLGFGAGLVGATPVEFLGAQVFESEQVPLAVGLTDAWMIVGEGQSVRDAIRRAADPAQGLAQEARFQRALDHMSARPSIAGFESMDRTVPMTLWSITEWERATRDAWEGFGLEPEQIDSFIDAVRERREALAAKAPRAEDILRHVDASAISLEPTPDGFDVRVAWIAPE